MKKLDNKKEIQIQALAVMVEYVTEKEIFDQKEIEEIDNKLTQIIASIKDDNKFFKRLS